MRMGIKLHYLRSLAIIGHPLVTFYSRVDRGSTSQERRLPKHFDLYPNLDQVVETLEIKLHLPEVSMGVIGINGLS